MRETAPSLARRRFLRGAARATGMTLGALAGLPALAPAAEGKSKSLPTTALEKSDFVYVSPLRSNGRESTCHGEIWYAWFDGEVVAIVSREGWKARAISKGLAKTRIWVGNHGRWKGLISNNEAFRGAPSFEAVGRLDKNDALLDRLMKTYRSKYPAEIANWESRMRSGHADGSRVLVRYRPVG